MLLRLWIRDCPDMVASQQQTLADVAARFTTRLNLGVASIYTPSWAVRSWLRGSVFPG